MTVENLLLWWFVPAITFIFVLKFIPPGNHPYRFIILRAITMAYLITPTPVLLGITGVVFPAGAVLLCAAIQLVTPPHKNQIDGTNLGIAILCLVLVSIIAYAIMARNYKKKLEKESRVLGRKTAKDYGL